jgi:hypothetical protein
MPFLQTGLGASAFAGGYGGAAVPAQGLPAPAGPRTIGAMGFGTVAGDDGGSNTPAYAILGGGALALGLLVFIWWSLPR